MTEADEVFDVAIVGYGPVGSVLAILLGELGHRVVVLERWPTPYPLPRAVHFDDEVARILQACGIGGQLPAITEVPDQYEWRNAEGRTLLRFGLGGIGISGWPHGSMFNQPQLEDVLNDRARALPTVTIRRGAEVTAIVDDGHVVSVEYRTVVVEPGADVPTPTGEHGQLRARYVVGCDGCNSMVRDQIDTHLTDLGFFYDWLIVDVILNEARVFEPTNLQLCDPARPTTVVSGGPGRRRWEFMRLPSETIDHLNDTTTAWQLLEPWDVTPANARIERHAVYTFQARWVDQWRDRHVLLAGDAAHQMPPFAGQGMCAGLRDAANLHWKLDLVLRGHAGDELLDTYGQERKPSVEAAIGLSMELGKVICVPDPAAAAARDDAMLAEAARQPIAQIPPLPGITEGLRVVDDPLAGQLFLQANATLDGRIDLLDDLVGVGWRLISIDQAVASTIPPQLARWFAELGGNVITIGPSGTVQDTDGAYRDWFNRHDVTTVLQRPDFHVFGTVRTPTDPAALIEQARSMLAPAVQRPAHDEGHDRHIEASTS
jgi:2-polyprenyl-6-methoxyphenol hydroxylase-like FAD-dependent oxidoreductase